MRPRFGSPRKLEATLERELGRDVLTTLMLASYGVKVPIPIMGVAAAAIDGCIVPRVAGGSFASLSDLIAEATGGKKQTVFWNKTEVSAAPAVGATVCHWMVGALPAAGAAGAAPPGGTVPTRATTGALGQQNPAGGDTLHITTATSLCSAVGTTMIYDLLFHTQTAANPGTGSIAVTGTQNRYTGAAGTPEYAAGNVIVPCVSVTLAATAHNITYTYRDQDDNAGASSGAMVGRSGALVNTLDLTQPRWCADLAAGDTGVRQLTAIQFSASPATGQVNHSVIHPLALLPMPAANVGFVLDGINSAFNLVKVMSDACLATLGFMKSATAVATHAGQLELVSG